MEDLESRRVELRAYVAERAARDSAEGLRAAAVRASAARAREESAAAEYERVRTAMLRTGIECRGDLRVSIGAIAFFDRRRAARKGVLADAQKARHDAVGCEENALAKHVRARRAKEVCVAARDALQRTLAERREEAENAEACETAAASRRLEGAAAGAERIDIVTPEGQATLPCGGGGTPSEFGSADWNTGNRDSFSREAPAPRARAPLRLPESVIALRSWEERGGSAFELTVVLANGREVFVRLQRDGDEIRFGVSPAKKGDRRALFHEREEIGSALRRAGIKARAIG